MHSWRHLFAAIAIPVTLAAVAPEQLHAQAAAGAPGRWYEVTRLQLGLDSLEIHLVRADGRHHLGTLWDELARVQWEGTSAVRRTYRTTNRLFGAHHEVSHMTFPELRPLSDRTDAERVKGHTIYRPDSVVGWAQVGDSARTEFAVPADTGWYDGQSVDLLVRSADLAPDFRQEFRAFLPRQQKTGTIRVWVTGRDAVPGHAGRPADCWVVELDFDGLGSTMWIDERTRALHRQVIRLAPGIEIAMERHSGA